MDSLIFQLLFLIFLSIEVVSVYGERHCDLVTKQNITSSTRANNGAAVYINHFSTNKCLRVGSLGFISSKIFLDECFWGVKTITKDEKLYFKNSTLVSDGVTIFNDAGLDEKYCLSMSNDGMLKTSTCKSTGWDQLWKIKSIRGHDDQFQIQHSSSTLCLVPKSRSTKSPITFASCNAYKTEQLWKICVTSPK